MNAKAKVKEFVAHALAALHKAEKRFLAKVMVGTHAAYYAMVAWEAHASYKYAAGAVLVLMALEFLPGGDGEA